jgi:ubiquitin C-terminal hydrolase
MRLQDFLDEANAEKLIFGGYHRKDSILDELTVEELQEAVHSNIPKEKINARSVQKELESIIKTKIADAKFVAKKVIPELAKDLANLPEGCDYKKKKKKKIMEDSSQDAREVLEKILDALHPNKDSGKSKEMYDFGEDLEKWHDEHDSFTKKQAQWIWKTSEAMFGKKKKKG